MSDSVRRLRDKGRRRRHTRKKAFDKSAGAGAAAAQVSRDKARPALAPLHLLALLHNHARRPDSTNCDGFFSSPECSSRSASFDDFGDGGCGGDDAVVDAEEQQLRDELASSTTSSLSSSSSSSSTTWSSTDSGEWSDWEDPLWVKDDNLLHSCDRDRRRISPAAVVEPAAGQASGDTDSSSPQPARRPTTTKKKTTNKAKRNRRKRQQAVVRPASTAEQPTEPAHSAAALTERRGSAVDEEEEEDDDELVWRKRIGVEALEVQTEELRLSVAEDPVAAAAAVVLDLALDSPFSSADEVAAISSPVPILPTSPTAKAIAPKNPEAEWREAGVALMHNSEAAIRLYERPSDGSRRTTSVDVASSSSAPMPATPCLVELDGESLSTGRHRAPPPRPPRAFAPAASDGALTLAKRPRAPTAMATTTAEMSWATARESLPVVMLSSGGSRLRDMQLIREMIDEQQHRVAARKKRSKQAMAPATNPISASQETTRLSTTANTTKKNEKKTKKNEKKTKKKYENDGKKKDSYEGKRGKLKRKTKLWNSLRRLKEKTAGGGEGNGDGGGDGGVANNNNNMADIGQVYVAAMANKGVRASAAAIPTRRTTKPAPKNEVEENASAKKNEAKEKVVEMNDEADVGEVLSLSSASGHVMKVPVLNMAGLGSPASPTTATSSSPTSTTSWLVSSASMSAVPLSPGPAYDATPRPTSTAGVAHRPRNVSDPTGGSASSTLSSAESLSPRRRVWQAMTTPVVAAAGNRFRRNSRRFDHATSAAAEPLEWVASPLLDLLRQRQLGHHQQQPPQLARRQLRDYRTRSLHLPESPVAAAAHLDHLDHLADGERTLQSTA